MGRKDQCRAVAVAPDAGEHVGPSGFEFVELGSDARRLQATVDKSGDLDLVPRGHAGIDPHQRGKQFGGIGQGFLL